MKTKHLVITAVFLAGSIAVSSLQAQESATYKAKVPEKLLTPDKMDSSYLVRIIAHRMALLHIG